MKEDPRFLRENKLDEIEQHIDKGCDEYGMQTMDQHLIQPCRDALMTLDEAKRISQSLGSLTRKRLVLL